MYYEDFQLGTVFPVAPIIIEKERMLAFAKEYDPLPIHTDEAYARSTHFGDLIAPGVMTFMTIWTKFLEQDVFGTELIAGKSTKIEWIKPVYAGDKLTGKAQTTALTARNARNGIVEITVSAFNQHGVLVLTNVTEVVVKRKPQIDLSTD